MAARPSERSETGTARSSERPEVAAGRILAECGFEGVIPVDVVAVSSHLGILVVEEPKLDAQLSGMLVRREGGASPIIVVRKLDAPKRRRFTIAHEIGHCVLHAGRPVLLESNGKFRLNERRTGGEVPSPREETQANQFAAELLMPQPLVEEYFDRLAGRVAREDALIRSLAETFEVSDIAMKLRLINLGLASPA